MLHHLIRSFRHVCYAMKMVERYTPWLVMVFWIGVWFWGANKGLEETIHVSDSKLARIESSSDSMQSMDAGFVDDAHLKEALLSDNPYMKTDAIVYLEREGSEKSMQTLKGLLWDPTPTVVMEAASALARKSDESFTRELIEVFNANRKRVDGYGEPIRVSIIDALGEIGSVDAAELLGEEFFTKGSLMYRDHIVDALARIGGSASSYYLEQYLSFLIDNPPPEDWYEMESAWKQAMEKVQNTIASIAN